MKQAGRNSEASDIVEMNAKTGEDKRPGLYYIYARMYRWRYDTKLDAAAAVCDRRKVEIGITIGSTMCIAKDRNEFQDLPQWNGRK